jgi:cytochrome c oxidase subunit IV
VVDRPLTTEEQRAATEPGALAEEPELVKHPEPVEYVKVAVILAVATAFEVGLYYMNLPHSLFVTLLLFFAVMKFSLVALFFMHLRFDSRIFRRMFLTGLGLAVTVYMVVLLTFRVFIK